MFLIRAYVHAVITTDAVRGRGFEVSRFRPVLMFLIRAYVHAMITTDAVSMHAWGIIIASYAASGCYYDDYEPSKWSIFARNHFLSQRLCNYFPLTTHHVGSDSSSIGHVCPKLGT